MFPQTLIFKNSADEAAAHWLHRHCVVFGRRLQRSLIYIEKHVLWAYSTPNYLLFMDDKYCSPDTHQLARFVCVMIQTLNLYSSKHSTTRFDNM